MEISIWNRVMGSQPIRIQLGKILRENLAVNCCGKLLWEIVVVNRDKEQGKKPI